MKTRLTWLAFLGGLIIVATWLILRGDQPGEDPPSRNLGESTASTRAVSNSNAPGLTDQTQANQPRIGQTVIARAVELAANANFTEAIRLITPHASHRDLLKARELLRNSANAGHLQAQKQLAQMLEQGIGGLKNLPEAFRLYQQAAQGGDSDAQMRIARMLKAGIGTNRDVNLSRFWFEEAEKSGRSDASLELGKFYMTGEGVNIDYNIAFKYFRKASDSGISDGSAYLGMASLYGLGVPRDQRAGIRLLEDAADKGSSYAAVALLDFLAIKKGSASGTIGAEAELKWLNRAAELGDSRAQRLLGELISETAANANTLAEAEKWLSSAAKQGDSQALYALALFKVKQSAGSAPSNECVSLLKESAERGNWDAIWLLAQVTQRSPQGTATAEYIQRLVASASLEGDWRSAFIEKLMANGRSFSDAILMVDGKKVSDYYALLAEASAKPVSGVSAPIPVSMKQPEYPASALTADFDGTVYVEISIDPTGRVTKVAFQSRTDELVKLSVSRAAKEWIFYPAQKNGTALAARIRVPVRFRSSR